MCPGFSYPDYCDCSMRCSDPRCDCPEAKAASKIGPVDGTEQLDCCPYSLVPSPSPSPLASPSPLPSPTPAPTGLPGTCIVENEGYPYMQHFINFDEMIDVRAIDCANDRSYDWPDVGVAPDGACCSSGGQCD